MPNPVLVNGEPVNYSKCPEIARGILERYISGGCDPGTGYRLILAHDSFAERYVDDVTRAALPAITNWLRWNAPSACHGSLDKVRAWMKERRNAH